MTFAIDPDRKNSSVDWVCEMLKAEAMVLHDAQVRFAPSLLSLWLALSGLFRKILAEYLMLIYLHPSSQHPASLWALPWARRER